VTTSLTYNYASGDNAMSILVFLSMHASFKKV